MSRAYIWLSRAELVAAGACGEGLADFDRLVKSQGRRAKLRLTWDALGAALTWQAYPQLCAWLAGKGLIPPTATAGYGGTATAGYGGTATAGDGGTATAGYGGTATAGDYGTATAGYGGTATAGYGGTATAGDGGTATAGYGGTATAGDYGTVRMRWWCGATNRYRWAIGYVGEDGVLANVAYVVRDGKLVRQDGAS